MRPIGFSTGALAFSDFRSGLRMLAGTSATAVELSALRQQEFVSLVEALPSIDLQHYNHVSFHLPSAITPAFEGTMLEMVERIPQNWPLITHPDIIHTIELWTHLGSRLCIENMDKRKPIARTADELEQVFDRLPDASFCFDIGHANQIDPTMAEAVLILERLGSRLEQLHVSEVNSESKHDAVSRDSFDAFSVVAHLIPPHVPAILESRVAEDKIETEMRVVKAILKSWRVSLAGD